MDESSSDDDNVIIGSKFKISKPTSTEEIPDTAPDITVTPDTDVPTDTDVPAATIAPNSPHVITVPDVVTHATTPKRRINIFK